VRLSPRGVPASAAGPKSYHNSAGVGDSVRCVTVRAGLRPGLAIGP